MWDFKKPVPSIDEISCLINAKSFQLSTENFEQCFLKYVSLKVSFLLAPRGYIFLPYIPVILNSTKTSKLEESRTLINMLQIQIKLPIRISLYTPKIGKWGIPKLILKAYTIGFNALSYISTI